MKKTFLTVTVALACVGAFAQGKVRFVNDSLHLLYFTTNPQNLNSADAGLAGQALPSNGQGSLAAGVNIALDLWAGTTSSSLVKVAQTTMTSGALGGTFNGANVSLPAPMNAAGTYFFQVQVYDLTAGSYAAASAANGQYYGASSIFQSTANSGAAFYSIVQLITPASSTWAIGSQNLDSQAAGDRGAIQVQLNAVPEPTTIALGGLGFAALAIMRRRK